MSLGNFKANKKHLSTKHQRTRASTVNTYKFTQLVCARQLFIPSTTNCKAEIINNSNFIFSKNLNNLSRHHQWLLWQPVKLLSASKNSSGSIAWKPFKQSLVVASRRKRQREIWRLEFIMHLHSLLNSQLIQLWECKEHILICVIPLRCTYRYQISRRRRSVSFTPLLIKRRCVIQTLLHIFSIHVHSHNRGCIRRL